jgi:hypothetical protein
MRTISIRLTSLAVFAVVAFGSIAAAQDKSPAVLNALEVQQLAARAEPSDHARLGAHFTALADRAAADAKWHAALAQSLGGNPTRNPGFGSSLHCARLAELNTQSAATLRELAAHHQKLAAGAVSTPPSGGAAFEGGAGAPGASQRDVNALAAAASTASDHQILETYFTSLASRYTAESKEHAALAAAWRRQARVPTAAMTAAHCERLAAQSRDAAKEATAAAAAHKKLAGTSR